MGVRLVGYFDEAQRIKGLSGKIKLAMLTKMSQDKAEAAPDSSENIAMFSRAIVELAQS